VTKIDHGKPQTAWGAEGEQLNAFHVSRPEGLASFWPCG
jgi:hypothetical protein